MLKAQLGTRLFCIFSLFSLLSCSSLPEIKTQAYARLKNEKTLDTELPEVWKAMEAVLRQYRILRRDPEEVSVVELKSLASRRLETDWIYSKSRTRYIEYPVNGFPQKTYLQNRYQFRILAQRVLGGTQVRVETREEIERLNSQGASAGYTGVDPSDSSLASDFIDKVEQALRSAAP